MFPVFFIEPNEIRAVSVLWFKRVECIVRCFPADQNPWFLQDNRAVCRNILHHDAVGTDPDVITNGNAADDFGTGADVDIIADRRGSAGSGTFECIGTDCDLLKYRAATANDGAL